MDNNRRNFFRKITENAAFAAVSVTAPALAYAGDFSAEMKKLSDNLNQKLSSRTEALGQRISDLGNRVDAASINQAYLQAQLHLIFLLLVISFLIDGGLSLSMFVLN